MTSIYGQQGAKLPRLQHASLPVPTGTHAKIREFYSGVLGLQEKPIPPSVAPMGVLWFGAGDNEMELHLIPDDGYLANPKEGRHICLEVADVEQYRGILKEAGYEIIEAAPILHRPRFFTHDPFGNRLEFTTIEGDYQG
jgi:catechol 2,3-dioxygenase-like lactoylglutathione lyase family enzyme